MLNVHRYTGERTFTIQNFYYATKNSVFPLTFVHARHFPDLPGGEITIEGTSTVKHCTTHSNKEKSKDKNGFEKKRGESIVQK